MTQSRVTRSSLDRFAIVVMAGIAAEALMFDRAEGGADDEKQLIKLLTDIQPPWNIVRIQSQARWAVVQAFLLVKEHRASYDALVQVLTAKAGTGDVGSVGDLIEAVEKNLPAVLPSNVRIAEKESKRKNAEIAQLFRYIQKMTWRAGALQLGNADKESSVQDQEQQTADAVAVFARKMKALEVAVKSGDLDLSAKIKQGGERGVWVNGLKARDADRPSEVPLPNAKRNVDLPKHFVIPPPLEGYEERLAQLNSTDVEDQESTVEKVDPKYSSFDKDLFAVPLMVRRSCECWLI